MLDWTVHIQTVFPLAKLPSRSERQIYLLYIERDLDLRNISADVAL